MIKIKYIFVVLLIAMSLYSYGLDIKPSTEIPEILQGTPLFLNNVTRISNYPHKIVISKSVNGYDLTNKDILNRNIVSYKNINLKEILYEDMFDEKTSKKFKNTTLYTITFNKSKDRGFSILSMLTDEKDNIIWDCNYTKPNIGIPNVIYCVEELEKDKYVVVYLASVVIFVNYIHLDNDTPIIESYQLPFISVGAETILPENVSVLTEDIIRLEYKDGAIEHWKAKLSEDDVNKNMEIAIKKGLSESSVKSERRNALIWWNAVGKGSQMNHNLERAWDYDDNINYEPVYENML